MRKDQLEFAGSLLNEEHGPKVQKKVLKLRTDVDDYRQEILKIIKGNYPKQLPNFVEVSKKLDDAFNALEKLAEKL